jgi:hypothetical protein
LNVPDTLPVAVRIVYCLATVPLGTTTTEAPPRVATPVTRVRSLLVLEISTM